MDGGAWGATFHGITELDTTERLHSLALRFWSTRLGQLLTEYHSLRGLNKNYLFLLVLEAGRSKIKAPADSVSGKGPLPGL